MLCTKTDLCIFDLDGIFKVILDCDSAKRKKSFAEPLIEIMRQAFAWPLNTLINDMGSAIAANALSCGAT